MANNDVLLSIRDLKTYFASGKGPIRAVDGVSFEVRRGETFALLGESGCGKSMTALSIMQLLPQQAVGNVSGEVALDGQDLLSVSEMAMQSVRGRRIAMIFQEPMTSLNPVLTVGEQIGEVLQRHRGLRGGIRRKRVLELLDAVGIPDRSRRYGDYPHQLSGGMKQRVMIAIALAGEPELLIADEPTTALDVSVQAQILNLLKGLQDEMGLAYLFITHNMSVVEYLAHTVAVMYLGRIVEQGRMEEVLKSPRHPYTQALLSAIPTIDETTQREVIRLQGDLPSPVNPPQGCHFHPRCPHASEVCRERYPWYTKLSNTHHVNCFLYGEGNDR